MAAQSDENKRSPLKAWVRALERTAPIERQPSLTLPLLIGQLAERFEDAPALSGLDATLSYRGLSQALNRYARWGLARGLKSGDVVCLFMENCPHYLAIWLGLSQIGVTVALLNTNLAGQALSHSINTVSPRLLISGARLAAAVSAVRRELAGRPECWVSGGEAEGLPRLDTAIASFSGEPPPASLYQAPTLSQRALCIYTSGTTGLPKAANVSHYRLMQWSHWFAGLMDVTPSDRMYNCLPMYHSVGGVVATGATLVGGGAVVLRERFSASGFWRDVAAERCTLFSTSANWPPLPAGRPPQPHEAQHRLRLACGNGLRADVWVPFQQRIRIPQILEYYAATEGNFSLYNCEGRPGAIGRIPPFLAHRLPVAVVRFDVATGLPARDANGRCLRCGVDEPVRPSDRSSKVGAPRASRVHGRRGPGHKVLRDVFTPGMRYRTGDLMRQDAGILLFRGSVGETFRWKGGTSPPPRCPR
jgi:fatty-acyl-CoA synthase